MNKKIVLIFLIMIMSILTSCTHYDDYQLSEYEDDYFVYAVETDDYGVKAAYIVDLTDLGKQQTHLIVPKYYNDYEVHGFGYVLKVGFMNDEEYTNLNYDTLEKVYVNFEANSDHWIGQYAYARLENAFLVKWYDSKNVEIQVKKGYIIGYNIYSDYQSNYSDSNNIYKIANVSYMYNFDNADNNGYYWVDSFNQSIIDYIPPEPTRDGYQFDGWYKDPTCTISWDFANDIVGEELLLTSASQYSSYEGIYLYAKWIED